jgi:hypothetical protein
MRSFTSPDIISDQIKEDEMGIFAARMEEMRNAYRILVFKLGRKRPLGRPCRRWDDNIKVDLKSCVRM